MKRRTFIKTAGLTALGACFPAPIGQVLPAQAAESRLPVTGPLSGRRILTFNSVIRVNQIEVTRTRNEGFDEYDRHAPENIKALRAAFTAGWPGGPMTWALSWRALEDPRPNYQAARRLVREFHDLSRNWSLLGRINQKQTRPQDQPCPLAALPDDDRALIRSVLTELGD